MPRLATYNAHDCIGRDGRYAPERIAGVVAGIDADIVALQEITLDHAGDVLRCFSKVTGMHAVDGMLFDRGVGRYGNLLLSRSPALHQAAHDISFAGREARGVLDARFVIAGQRWHILATHLGLSLQERRAQMSQIVQLAAQSDSDYTAVMGDFNVWAGSRAFRHLTERGFRLSHERSFPTLFMPLLRLDRILIRGRFTQLEFSRYDQNDAAMASDHYPVVADLEP